MLCGTGSRQTSRWFPITLASGSSAPCQPPPRPTPSPVSLSTGRAWDSRPTSGARQSRWDVTLVIILYEVVTSVFVQTVSDDAT